MLNVLTEKEVEAAISKPIGSEVEFKRMRAWLDDCITRGAKKKFSDIVTITPVLATLLLERNPKNRPINKRGKNEIRQDLANGKFVFNGQPIIVSDTGILNDGQHRLHTVVETGISIEVVIVFGATEASRFTVDSGRSKTVSNFLAMKGRKYSLVLGAAVNYTLQWREEGRIAYGSGSEKKPTKQMILVAADEIKGIDTSVDFTSSSALTVRSHAVLAFCHNVFWKKSSRENADFFMTKLIEGDGLRKGDPILFCRNKLLNMDRGYDAGCRAELIFKCWNAWRNGAQIQAFRPGGKGLPKVER